MIRLLVVQFSGASGLLQLNTNVLEASHISWPHPQGQGLVEEPHRQLIRTAPTSLKLAWQEKRTTAQPPEVVNKRTRQLKQTRNNSFRKQPDFDSSMVRLLYHVARPLALKDALVKGKHQVYALVRQHQSVSHRSGVGPVSLPVGQVFMDGDMKQISDLFGKLVSTVRAAFHDQQGGISFGQLFKDSPNGFLVSPVSRAADKDVHDLKTTP